MIDIGLELPEELDGFMNFLPFAIKKKYIDTITDAVSKNDGKSIDATLKSILDDLYKTAISKEDVAIFQESLNNIANELKLNAKNYVVKRKEPKEELLKSTLYGKVAIIEDEIECDNLKELGIEIPQLEEQHDLNVKQKEKRIDKTNVSKTLSDIFGKTKDKEVAPEIKKDIEKDSDRKIDNNR